MCFPCLFRKKKAPCVGSVRGRTGVCWAEEAAGPREWLPEASMTPTFCWIGGWHWTDEASALVTRWQLGQGWDSGPCGCQARSPGGHSPPYLWSLVTWGRRGVQGPRTEVRSPEQVPRLISQEQGKCTGVRVHHSPYHPPTPPGLSHAPGPCSMPAMLPPHTLEKGRL